ncbi:MAG: hypothetical protein L7W43_11945 [Rubripirellula sp.]|nr:hypothetical protein [Rubripirellula sp.]
MHKFLAAMLSLITTALCFSQTRSHAAHATPLFHATREYRDAAEFLARLLSYHGTLDQAQTMFLKRLVHSSRQLYAATLSCHLKTGVPLGSTFRQTWAPIPNMVQDLPWMLETLPPDVQQRVTDHCREFFATYQTLAIQIELRESAATTQWTANSAIVSIDIAKQVLTYRTNLAALPPPHSHSHPRKQAWPLGTRSECYDMAATFRSRRTLSPSEWQLQKVKTPRRSETPTRSKTSHTGVRLTRLGQHR